MTRPHACRNRPLSVAHGESSGESVKLEFHGSSILVTSSPTRPTGATSSRESSRGCREDATRKLLPLNLILKGRLHYTHEHAIGVNGQNVELFHFPPACDRALRFVVSLPATGKFFFGIENAPTAQCPSNFW